MDDKYNQLNVQAFDIGKFVRTKSNGDGIILSVLPDGKYEVGLFDGRIYVLDVKTLEPTESKTERTNQ
jgi:hypothetical protein